MTFGNGKALGQKTADVSWGRHAADATMFLPGKQLHILWAQEWLWNAATQLLHGPYRHSRSLGDYTTIEQSTR